MRIIEKGVSIKFRDIGEFGVCDERFSFFSVLFEIHTHTREHRIFRTFEHRF